MGVKRWACPNLNRGSYLVEWLGVLEREVGKGGEQFWPTTTGEFDADILQPLEKIDDWRPAIAAIKGVGPKRATNLRDKMLESGTLDTLGQALIWASTSKRNRKLLPKIPLWGDVTFNKVRAAVVGDEDIEGELCWCMEDIDE